MCVDCSLVRSIARRPLLSASTFPTCEYFSGHNFVDATNGSVWDSRGDFDESLKAEGISSSDTATSGCDTVITDFVIMITAYLLFTLQYLHA